MQRLCRGHTSSCCNSRLHRPCSPHTGLHQHQTSHASTIQNNSRFRLCSAASSPNAAATAATTAAKTVAEAAAASTMTVYFREEEVTTSAAVGDDLIEVAAAAGVIIPTGCWQGNCGVCEVEVYKYTGDADHDKAAATSPAVVRACVTKLPPGYSRIEVAQMQDAIWGLDGYDT